MENPKRTPYLYLWAGGTPPEWLDNHKECEILHPIFVACREKAKSAKELSYELGITQSVLEQFMTRAAKDGSLKQSTHDAYLTDFCVIPAQAYYDAECHICDVFEHIGQEITMILEQKKDIILAQDFYGNTFPYPYLLWILYVFACNRFGQLANDKNRSHWQDKIPCDNGKNYRLTGIFTMPDEEVIEREDPIKQVTWSNRHIYFESGNSQMEFVNYFDYPPFPQEERNGLVNAKNVPLLLKLIESDEDYSPSLTRDEAEHVAFLRHKGIVIKQDGVLKINIPVMSHDCEEQILRILDDLIRPLVDKYVGSITKVAEDFIRPHIRADLLEEYVNTVQSDLYNPLEYVLYWAMYIGETLDMPREFEHSAAGLYLKTASLID